MNFKEYYSNEKIKLEKEINEFNNTLLKEDNYILNYNLDIFKNLNSNGKLIRGVLVNLGYKLLNKDNLDYSNKLALAYEVFQTSILIHDDIIDNDNFRRGKKTIHYSNYNKYSNYSNDKNELVNLSNSVGICIGDYGLYLSNKIISDSYKNDLNLGNLLSYFNNIVLKTIKGELIDVVLPFESKYNIIKNEDLESNIMDVYKLKTAYYTIVGPLSSGMILAKTTEDKLKDIEKLGEKIGIAYQIQDDILGIYSDNMGKVVGSDIKEFKQTILYSYIICKNESFKDDLLKYYGKEITKESIENIRNLFDKSGAKKYSIDLMNNLYDEAIEILNNISWIKEEDKNILNGLINYLRERNK
jgi:geranylgeranyl pyrophosphate synthase